MELREFAERVLFSDCLETKLTALDGLTDEEPGAAIVTPGAPGRPTDLVMRMDKSGDRAKQNRARFPGAHRLMDEEQRGVLLHFFANHELLATELMALVLLKFPEAPKAFRRDILRTLREEQEHTRWYLERMGDCGVRFGDFTLNRFFWDAIAPMETPLDYVTRLSLTFEQANLDYARHYETVLRDAGDEKTAGILGRIYHDEIAHVGYGLKWFRRWKDERENDWEAYRRSLRFPLSPSRGKGNVPFNEEGRLRAGLEAGFVREMRAFEMSKGRTPNIFVFHPQAEACIAAEWEGRRYQAKVAEESLVEDLEILSAFLSRKDDVVLMRRMPSLAERERLADLGFQLPELVALDGRGGISKESGLSGRKWNALRPWSWSPEMDRLFAPFTLEKTVNADQERSCRSELFSKEFAATFREGLAEMGLGSWAVAGRVCRSLEEVDAAVSAIRKKGDVGVYLKGAFGAAGQKNRRLLAGEALVGTTRRWAERLLTAQPCLVVEPWLERIYDFSVQYEFKNGELKKVAMLHGVNDSRGQFQACIWGPKFGAHLNAELAQFLFRDAGQGSPISIYDSIIPESLAPLLEAHGHEGPLGIDAMVYRDAKGLLQLQAVVEINPRFTMGRLTWELSRQIAPGRSLRFELVGGATEKLRRYAEGLSLTNKPEFNSKGRLVSGAVVLNDAEIAQRVLAVLQVIHQ